MIQSLLFTPLLPVSILILLAVLACAAVLLALWRGLKGWALRAMAAVIVLFYLTGPSLQKEQRSPLSDIVLMIEDQTASQNLSDRAAQSRVAADLLAERIVAQENIELRRIPLPDGEGDAGTQLLTALDQAVAQEPRGRIAGVIAISDGQIHDGDLPVDLPAPLHLIQSGQAGDWDRSLTLRNAPAFGIMGEPVVITVHLEDKGAVATPSDTAFLDISINGEAARQYDVPLGQDIEIPIKLPHSGRNVIRFGTPEVTGEITERNNSALVQINGVRDRLRVLLVSGEPHAGGRTWRNLLKSDASVDLVHFVILRPANKQDGVPVSELSLIAFPAHELFMEKIHDFDLIIFDRYKLRGILPPAYLENIARYAEQGGAVLIAAGPDFASAASLYRSPLGRVLPARPSARVFEQPYKPVVTDLGKRHPVTAGLQTDKDWGKWLRQIGVTATSGDVVMEGLEGQPLLVLDRVGEGRVALLASDQAWLWGRGYDGGGPQMELLRRLGHWMMKEPELEEEALTATATGHSMRILRRTLGESVPEVTLTAPDGSITTLPLENIAPGQFAGQFEGVQSGLYRLQNGDQESVIGLGPAAPREFVETIATADLLAPLIKATGGGVHRIEEGVPDIRMVREGRPSTGRGWIGLTARHAFEVHDIKLPALMPAWLTLMLAGLFVLGAWMREGRR